MVSHPVDAAEAEAAAWIARLQSADRDDATEAGLKTWLQADPANEDAFERATDIWALLPGAALLTGAAVAAPKPARAALPDSRWLALAASILLVMAVGASLMLFSGRHGYATRVGEQKVATLDDGSRIALNTDTELEVRYSPDTRRIRLSRGEAIFEVAPNAARPFIVEAGDKQIRAIGTRFLVRRGTEGVSVILIEGKVAVTDIAPERGAAAQAVLLAPGERLTTSREQVPTIDRPAMDAVTAWRRGQVIFSDTPLAAAAAEFNRYGGASIVFDDPHLASLRVSGVFATHEPDEFAIAVATLHGLRVVKTRNELRIVR